MRLFSVRVSSIGEPSRNDLDSLDALVPDLLAEFDAFLTFLDDGGELPA